MQARSSCTGKPAAFCRLGAWKELLEPLHAACREIVTVVSQHASAEERTLYPLINTKVRCMQVWHTQWCGIQLWKCIWNEVGGKVMDN